MKQQFTTTLDLVSGFTALCSVLCWGASGFLGAALREWFPTFDGVPLFLILLCALVLLCVVNRVAARAYAMSRFGMPPSERRKHLEGFMEECRKDPEAVLHRYDSLDAVPVFLLVLYVVIAFALGVIPMLCIYVNCPWWRLIPCIASFLLSFAMFGMLFYRCFDVRFGKRLNKKFLVPEGKLPIMEAMVKRAADTVGIKGKIRLEMTRDCDLDVNRFGNTYVVFLGSRLLSVLTEEELYQLLLMSFDFFSHKKEYRRTHRVYRLGQLGSAEIRPLFFIFDLFFSYADVYLEWEYDLYMAALRRYADGCACERVKAAGNPAAAVSALDKRAMWRYFAFESNDFLTIPFYAPEKPEKKHEAMVCDAWRAAITKRYGVWRRLLSAEIPTATDMRPLHREYWNRLSPDGQVSDGRLTLPQGDTPFDREVATTALEMVETRLYGEIRNGYDRARRDEYLEPLETIAAYEKNPSGYTTPELSPVINAYRDICRVPEAEKICDGILSSEQNRFARAHAAYFKGMCRIHRYDTGGIDLIYQAIDLNKNYMEDGFSMVEEYCIMCGLADEYETFLRRAETQMAAHARNHEGAGSLSPMDHLVKEEELGDMLPDILAYMEQVSEGKLKKVYLVRKVISEDFFSSVFVISFEEGEDNRVLRRAYDAIFNYLDSYPVDWQFSLFVCDPNTLMAVSRVEGSLVWEKKNDK